MAPHHNINHAQQHYENHKNINVYAVIDLSHAENNTETGMGMTQRMYLPTPLCSHALQEDANVVRSTKLRHNL